MKKLLCGLLALSLIFCAVALAEGAYDQDDNTASTTLTTTIKAPDAPSYTIIIPPTLEIAPNANSTRLGVQLTEMTNAQSVTVATAANGSMKNSSSGSIDYTVTNNTLSWDSPSEKWMTINITDEEWQQAPAGAYTGTMSFTISVTPAE